MNFLKSSILQQQVEEGEKTAKKKKGGGTFLLSQKPRQLESRFLESVWDLEADVFSKEIWERRVASFKCQAMVNKPSNGLIF